jgi:hypothetical protein
MGGAHFVAAERDVSDAKDQIPDRHPDAENVGMGVGVFGVVTIHIFGPTLARGGAGRSG